MLKSFTIGAALAAVLTTTIIDTQTASSVEADNQLLNSSKSVSVSNEFASNNHRISTVIAVSIVLLLIRNQRQALSKTRSPLQTVSNTKSQIPSGLKSKHSRKQANKYLQSKLLNRVDRDVADRLISSAKKSNPGKSEQWYCEKVIYDLNRDRR